MIVPSRSTKTAGNSASLIFAVLSETGDKFISRHGSRSKFANHNCASVVGDFRCLDGSRSADESKGKERNGSIAGARNIENLSCLGWNIMRRFVLLKKHHPVFAERDENIFSVPFLKKCFSDATEVDVVRRNSIRIAHGNTGSEKSFCPIWCDHRGTMPVH